MSHKFKVGQQVRLTPLGPGQSTPAAVFEILRLTPEDRAGEPSYRIRLGTGMGGERAARESELTPIPRG